MLISYCSGLHIGHRHGHLRLTGEGAWRAILRPEDAHQEQRPARECEKDKLDDDNDEERSPTLLVLYNDTAVNKLCKEERKESIVQTAKFANRK